MTTLRDKIKALEKINEKDPAFKAAFQALRIESRALRAAKRAARGLEATEGPSGARDFSYGDSINRADYVNIRNDNERGPFGYYINNWNNSDSKWTSSGQSRDDELGDGDYIAVNGLRFYFYIGTNDPNQGPI
jgi:hypothetical protein